jgi:hypothetical protein
MAGIKACGRALPKGSMRIGPMHVSRTISYGRIAQILPNYQLMIDKQFVSTSQTKKQCIFDRFPKMNRPMMMRARSTAFYLIVSILASIFTVSVAFNFILVNKKSSDHRVSSSAYSKSLLITNMSEC